MKVRKRKIATDNPPVLMVRTRNGFSPATPYDDERLQYYAMGAECEVTIWQERSDPIHRLYWVLLGLIAKNQGHERGFSTAESIHWALKESLGYTQYRKTFSGKELHVPVSTAKDKMDEAAFKEYFEKCKQALAHVFGIDIDELIAEGKRISERREKLETSTPYHGAPTRNVFASTSSRR